MYKVLLDENLPVRIKYRLQDACEIYTVSDKGWNALEMVFNRGNGTKFFRLPGNVQ